MAHKVYIGVSNDKSYTILFRPFLDVYPDTVDRKVHFCYLDIEGLKEENVDEQSSFYTDFEVTDNKLFRKVLSDYQFFSVPGEDAIDKTTPVSLEGVIRGCTRRAKECEDILKELTLREAFPEYYAKKETQAKEEKEEDFELEI